MEVSLLKLFSLWEKDVRIRLKTFPFLQGIESGDIIKAMNCNLKYNSQETVINQNDYKVWITNKKRIKKFKLKHLYLP